MKETQSVNPLDFSVNAVLDITPRRIGKLAFRICTGIYHAVTQTEIKALRKEIAEMRKEAS